MKKLTFIIALSLAATSIFAQKQGQIYVGGSLGFSSHSEETTASGTTTKNFTESNLNFSPGVGYFLADNISAGLRLTFSPTTTTFPAAGATPEKKATQNNTGIIPFARYHMMGDGNFGFFGELSLPIFPSTGTSTTQGGTTTEFKGSMFGVSVRPGFIYFLTDNIGLETTLPGLDFISSSIEDGPASDPSSSKTNTTIFGFNLNTLGLGFGFNYYF